MTGLSAATCAAGNEIVVAVSQPFEAYFATQLIRGNFVDCPHRIARALHDERRAARGGEMRNAQRIGFFGG